MAKRRARATVGRSTSSNGNGNTVGSPGPSDQGETTGRMIVTFRDDSTDGMKKGLARLQNVSGLSSVSRMSDYDAAEFSLEDATADAVLVMDELGVAVVSGNVDQHDAMVASMAEDDGLVIEKEYVNFAMADLLDDDILEPRSELDTGSSTGGALPLQLEYLHGYYEAVKHLYERLAADALGGRLLSPDAAAGIAGVFRDTATATWGIHATGVLGSSATGRRIKVAILDTGLDERHPDFRNRRIVTRSFIAGETAMDVHGHGTHCTGTACGPLRPSEGPRYGIAYESDIFHGKVLSNGGSGSDGGILAGINWAIQNRCHVISMSLGRRTVAGERPMTAYETAGRRALNAGTLIVAAAGNESDRPGSITPVGSPANAASIAAVAALAPSLQVARFSNGGINPSGGEVNLAAPGVAVRSSLPLPRRYASWSGTSMATPHVAGIAALIAQQSTAFRGLSLYREIRRRARRLPLPVRDVGNGLTRAIG